MTDVSVQCIGPVRGVMAIRKATAYRIRDAISEVDHMDLALIVLPCGDESKYELQCGSIGVVIVVRQLYVLNIWRSIQASAVR